MLVLFHLYPVAFAAIMRVPEVVVFAKSSPIGMAVSVTGLAVLLHLLYQLLYAMDIFYFVIEIAILFGLSKMFKKSIDPLFSMDKINLTGKLVLITGKAAATELAKRGAQVIIASRNDELSAAACKEINQFTTKDNRASFIQLDLSSLQKVRDFADSFKEKYEKLDILINNAGMVMSKGKSPPSVDGYELHFAVMHLGHFLLTTLLLPLLQKTKGSRVINIASEGHRLASAGTFNDLKSRVQPGEAYGRAKLANVLFTREFARRYGNTILCCCLHPGAVFTSIWDFPTGKIKPIADHLWRIFDFAGFWLMRTPLEGISDIMLLCTTQDRELYNGKYLMSMKPQETNKYGKSESLAKELWTKSEEIVKKFTL